VRIKRILTGWIRKRIQALLLLKIKNSYHFEL
jgi:hypothetical protein